MRRAIKDTNVVLNMAISPGIILVPSRMIILDKKITGYNNVLKLATKNMKFAENKLLNYYPSNGASASGRTEERKKENIIKNSNQRETSSLKNISQKYYTNVRQNITQNFPRMFS